MQQHQQQKQILLSTTNEAGSFASRIMQSQVAQSNGPLWQDYQLLITGHAIYLPHALASLADFSLLRRLCEDLEKFSSASPMIQWSKHLKHEDPTFSSTFREIVDRMAAYFDVEVYATRLNFYPDTSSWKPFHHDSHAYGGEGRALREDFTMGASFGATRELIFMHTKSQQQFSFPQKNGDIFAFNSFVNERFMHGIPKTSSASPSPAPRFSIIAWGRRRTLNARNAGRDEIGCRNNEPQKQQQQQETNKKPPPQPQQQQQEEKPENIGMSMSSVRESIDRYIAEHSQRTAQPPATASKSRVQGGWSGPAAPPKGKTPGWSAMKKTSP